MPRTANFNVLEKALSALNDSLAMDVWDDSSVVLQVKNTGSAATAAGVLVFEASINSTNGINGDWFPVSAALSNSNSIVTGRVANSLAAGAVEAFAYKISVSAYRWFRVRVSTAFTASSIAFITALASESEVEFVPSVASHAVTISSGAVTITLPTATTSNVVGIASTNAANVLTAAGTLFEVTVFNPTAAKVFVKFYNKASTPAPATDTPVLVIPVEAGAGAYINLGAVGKRFSTGLGYAIVANAASNDATAVAAGVLLNFSRA